MAGHHHKSATAWSENAIRVLRARYLRRNGNGLIAETPEQMLERVARAVSVAELTYGPASTAQLWERRFHEMLASLEFLPNSPTLMNAGLHPGQLSACFVLPVEDTLESIFRALSNMASIQSSGGGTGFSFSHLRSRGQPLRSTGGISSGPVSFIKIFDSATENIRLGGRRRGANMAVLRVDHPDILEFIDCKREGNALSNFNLSVAVTDAFMSAVASRGTVQLREPLGGTAGRHPARRIFDRICEAAWETGDPGLVFYDTIQRANPTPDDGEIESTNPCGEVPLLPWESCNLGSINLTRFMCARSARVQLDWKRLRQTVHDAVRFLDDVISVNRYPLSEVQRATEKRRKIGLGVMGFAEACILGGIGYDTRAALVFADKLMAFIALEARRASAALAKERGPFPTWDRSRYAATGVRLRNATLTSIAPTGTISLIAGTSPGIEPLFGLAYRRVGVLEGKNLLELNPIFARRLGSDAATRKVMEHVLQTGSLSGAPGCSPELQRLFVAALQVVPEQHVRIQAVFQKHVDNAVSKTVNLPSDASVEQVANVYRLAHRLGCKGITIFRQGSRENQVIQLGTTEDAYEHEYFARCDPGACNL